MLQSFSNKAVLERLDLLFEVKIGLEMHFFGKSEVIIRRELRGGKKILIQKVTSEGIPFKFVEVCLEMDGIVRFICSKCLVICSRIPRD